MRKLAVALGVLAVIAFAGSMAWKADAGLEVRHFESSLRDKELFADRAGRLRRLGEALPAWIHVALRPVQVLVQTLLAWSEKTSGEAAALGGLVVLGSGSRSRHRGFGDPRDSNNLRFTGGSESTRLTHNVRMGDRMDRSTEAAP